MEQFPEKLIRLREKECKSRKVLSELCGLAPDAIRKYESREVKPSIGALIAIADYFDVSLDYLAGRPNKT